MCHCLVEIPSSVEEDILQPGSRSAFLVNILMVRNTGIHFLGNICQLACPHPAKSVHLIAQQHVCYLGCVSGEEFVQGGWRGRVTISTEEVSSDPNSKHNFQVRMEDLSEMSFLINTSDGGL